MLFLWQFASARQALLQEGGVTLAAGISVLSDRDFSQASIEFIAFTQWAKRN